jgi:hypothetical protein
VTKKNGFITLASLVNVTIFVTDDETKKKLATFSSKARVYLSGVSTYQIRAGWKVSSGKNATSYLACWSVTTKYGFKTLAGVANFTLLS